MISAMKQRLLVLALCVFAIVAAIVLTGEIWPNPL